MPRPSAIPRPLPPRDKGRSGEQRRQLISHSIMFAPRATGIPQPCEAISLQVSKSRAKQEKLSSTLDMHSVRIEKATAAVAKLQEQIKGLQEEACLLEGSRAM